MCETSDFVRTVRLTRAEPGRGDAGGDGAAATDVTDGTVVRTLLPAVREWWRALEQRPLVHPVFFFRGQLVVGPTLTCQGRVCPTCLAMRLGAAFPHPTVYRALLQAAHVSVTGAADAWLEQAGRVAEPFVDKHWPLLDDGWLAVWDTGGRDFVWKKSVPVPGEHGQHAAAEDLRPLIGGAVNREPVDERLLFDGPRDRFLGPLAETKQALAASGEPAALRSYVTVTGFLGELTTWRAEVSGGAVDFDPERARKASIGEAVERYSGNYVPTGLVWASEDELSADGVAYLPLTTFQHGAGAHCGAGSPFREVLSNEAVEWASATDVANPAARTLIPAEAVYLNYTRHAKVASALPVQVAGIAAGVAGVDGGTIAALLELVERDSTMLWWHAHRPARVVTDLPQDLAALLTAGSDPDVEQRALWLPSEFGVVVTAGCLLDHRNQVISVGFAARRDLGLSLQKSFAEAWQLRRLSLQLLDPEAALWRELNNGRLAFPVRPYRADRCYAADFAADFGDMVQLTYNLQYYLDPATHAAALERLDGEDITFTDLVKLFPPTGDLRETLVADLRGLQMRAWSTDCTTADLGNYGWRVTRVCAPGLVGNMPAAFPLLRHPRMAAAIAAAAQPPCLLPLPHA